MVFQMTADMKQGSDLFWSSPRPACHCILRNNELEVTRFTKPWIGSRVHLEQIRLRVEIPFYFVQKIKSDQVFIKINLRKKFRASLKKRTFELLIDSF